MSKHYDKGTLVAFMEGRLTEQEQESVNEHIETCDQCRQAMERLCKPQESKLTWDRLPKIVTRNQHKKAKCQLMVTPHPCSNAYPRLASRAAPAGTVERCSDLTSPEGS